MDQPFTSARSYTISCGRLRAAVTDLGAALVSLWVDGVDVVLGYDDAAGYLENDGFLGAVVGRCANRVRGAQFLLNGEPIHLDANEGNNCLHSGFSPFNIRRWDLVRSSASALTLRLLSPHGDQGFPGTAQITVTYAIEDDALTISYDAVSDRDTVFNFTNHTYFNLAGHDCPEKAMDQILTLNAAYFLPADAESIPTGEIRSVEGTPFDFRSPKALGRDLGANYEPLHLQGGYDHHFVTCGECCAVLTSPDTGITMRVVTDCPGVQLYTANFLDVTGKGGVPYPRRSGICLETQFAPDSVNHPEWPQPFTKTGQRYHSETKFQF